MAGICCSWTPPSWDVIRVLGVGPAESTSMRPLTPPPPSEPSKR